MFRNQSLPTRQDYFVPAGGAIWQQLHSERENVCEALLHRAVPIDEASSALHDWEPADESSRDVEYRRAELLQMRLCNIDNALDRLMAGSYGVCSDCGKHIEPERLAIDAAASYCRTCQARMEN